MIFYMENIALALSHILILSSVIIETCSIKKIINEHIIFNIWIFSPMNWDQEKGKKYLKDKILYCYLFISISQTRSYQERLYAI